MCLKKVHMHNSIRMTHFAFMVSSPSLASFLLLRYCFHPYLP